MSKRHKYFRNLRYKQKLERLYDETSHSYPCRVRFLTKELDSRYASNYQYSHSKPSKYHDKHDKLYEYWDRPEVTYSIVKGCYGFGGTRKTYFKKYSNRRVRKSTNLGNHGNYKKVFDLWWTID